MKKSTSLNEILQQLTTDARALNLTDTEWAARAGIRKETLSRLRGKQSCDFVVARYFGESGQRRRSNDRDIAASRSLLC